MGEIIYNFSDEEFIPSDNGIFIKRFSSTKDDAYLYAIDQFLKERNYSGVCYIGEKRGEIPFEYFDQEYWDRSVMKITNNIIFFTSGKDMNMGNAEIKKYMMYVYSLKNQSIKKVKYNFTRYDAGSDEDYEELHKLINKLLDEIGR
ncbi:MAG: hypothetical protein MJ245_05675 [Clostridia bacterium]|nr:hypothetical protein [Clostridia bacterium]